MARIPAHRCAGMTLVELLVVLIILGLLTVTAIPLLVGNRDKKSIGYAADAAESMFSHVATKAMTAPIGAAVWLETTTTGAGSGVAVTNLALARVPAAATGTTTVSPGTPPTTAAVSLPAGFANDLPAPIEFAGIPGIFSATSTSTITSTSTTVSGYVNRTVYNSTVPSSPAINIPYTLHLPPRPSSMASATPLQGDVVIDLSASQIGLGSTAVTLGGYQRVAIEYDRTGVPTAVWMSPNTSGVSGGWSRQVLTSSTPIVLAIGMRSQAGQAFVASPTDDDPGASWQSPYARWLVIDPRNGSARIFQVGSSKSATNVVAAKTLAITPVTDEYSNTRPGG